MPWFVDASRIRAVEGWVHGVQMAVPSTTQQEYDINDEAHPSFLPFSFHTHSTYHALGLLPPVPGSAGGGIV